MFITIKGIPRNTKFYSCSYFRSFAWQPEIHGSVYDYILHWELYSRFPAKSQRLPLQAIICCARSVSVRSQQVIYTCFVILPAPLLNCILYHVKMDPREVEFLSEKQMVSIVPNFTAPEMFLISGTIGPFRPGLPVQVPIWVATTLKQQQKCRIIGQDWMDVDSLNVAKEEEKLSK